MPKLEGKIALITGGNSGIGLAVARRFVAEGAFVFIAGRRQDALDEAVEQLGGQACAIKTDVTSAKDLDHLFQTVRDTKGKLDIVVASSGIIEPCELAATSEAHFDQIFDVNTRAVLFTVKGALSLMAEGSSIVLIGSVAGFSGSAGYGTYGASKAALRAYARTWTNELAHRGIRVNTLSPGAIATAMFDATPDEVLEPLNDLIPLRRIGRPEEVAAAALFLASDESSYIAGSELCIDGGMAQV